MLGKRIFDDADCSNIFFIWLYGDKDGLTPLEAISEFVDRIGVSRTVTKDGKYCFCTDE